MRKILESALILLGLSACDSSAISFGAAAKPNPMLGCWESEDGLDREVWTADPSGWLFGYALSRDEQGRIIFVEQMRIETVGDREELVVVGQQGMSVRFVRTPSEAGVRRYENPEHDYPQVIIYKPGPGRLNAYVAYLNGTGRTDFKKNRCKSRTYHEISAKNAPPSRSDKDGS